MIRFLSPVSPAFGVDSFSLSFSWPIIPISLLPNKLLLSWKDIVPLTDVEKRSSYMFISATSSVKSSSKPLTVQSVHSSSWN